MAIVDNKRIAKNTIILYLRMIFLMVVSLYTSRIILNALGVDSYGVYSAVGGFIATFAILSNSLSAAVSRFITFELGKGNKNNLCQIFSSSVIMLLTIGLIILLLMETAGIWFLNNKMTIPADSVKAANWVLQFSALTFIINLISVPYNAAIIAHEKMSAFAFISMFEGLGKLLIAFIIANSSLNRLILYSGLLFLLSIIVRCIYAWYCNRNFEYTHLRFCCDRSIAKQIFAFSGWNFIGASSGVLRDQGVNVLLNVFCGQTVNAARSIAMQVNSAIQSLSTSFTTALNPQITKQYALSNYIECEHLVTRGARFTIYLLLLLAFPIFFETHQILVVWLKIVPPYAVSFVQLIIISVIVETISYSMTTLMLATGNIRNYQILVGGLQLLNFPISWLLLKEDISPNYTIVTAIVIGILSLMCRLVMLHRMIGFHVLTFIKDVIIRVLLVSILSSIVPLILIECLPESFLRLIVIIVTCLFSVSISVLYFGCNTSERTVIFCVVRNNIRKLYRNANSKRKI